MLSLISSLGGLLLSGLPNLLNFFQDRADKQHELALANLQIQQQLELRKAGIEGEVRMEEIRVDQIAMQTDAQRQGAALAHDAAIMDRASTWVVNLNGVVRPAVTFIFVMELVLINISLVAWIFVNGVKIENIDQLIKVTDVIFDDSEMALLSGIIAFWFGSRQWGKK
jgi:hypothetical protein